MEADRAEDDDERQRAAEDQAGVAEAERQFRQIAKRGNTRVYQRTAAEVSARAEPSWERSRTPCTRWSTFLQRSRRTRSTMS